MNGIRKLPRYLLTTEALLTDAKEAINAPVRQKLREYDLSEPQWRVMRVINERISTDATAIAVDASQHIGNVMRILRELESRELIARERDADDRRRNVIALTLEGRRAVRKVSHEILRIVRRHSSQFGPERLKMLHLELRAFSEMVK